MSERSRTEWEGLGEFLEKRMGEEGRITILFASPGTMEAKTLFTESEEIMSKVDVLLVEDNEDHIFLTRKAMLAANGNTFSLHVAMDGEEALDFVFKRGGHSDAPRPDLILLDINLPKKDGFQVLQELKKHPDYRTIPVTMLTSSDAYNDVTK